MLLVQLVAAAVLLTSLQHRQPPLTVGEGRVVELVNRGGPAGQELLARIAADLDGAVRAVEAFWGTDWTRRIRVIATGSDVQFAQEAGGGEAGRWTAVAAVAVADRLDPIRRVATGQRIVFAPDAAGMSPTALRLVLTHELFHYASRADTALDAPRWLTEGVADFVARDGLIVRPPAAPLNLPTDVELDTAGATESTGYDRAWWLVSYIADRYGRAALRRLYSAACRPGHPGIGTAVQRTLDVDLETLLEGWRRWPGPAEPGAAG